MSNYKQDLSAAWLRSKSVFIHNEYKEIPTIEFGEEFVVESEGKVISKTPMGSIGTAMKVPTTPFDLLHPETGAVIGTASYLDAYILLNSLYRFLGTKRDARDLSYNLLQAKKAEYDTANSDLIVATKEYNLAKELSDASPGDTALQTATADKLAIKTLAQATVVTKTNELGVVQATYDEAKSFLQ